MNLRAWWSGDLPSLFLASIFTPRRMRAWTHLWWPFIAAWQKKKIWSAFLSPQARRVRCWCLVERCHFVLVANGQVCTQRSQHVDALVVASLSCYVCWSCPIMCSLLISNTIRLQAATEILARCRVSLIGYVSVRTCCSSFEELSILQGH